MNHLTLRGTHREMGFQWGARLAERGLRLLDHVPFPLEAERRAFAAACRPAYARHFPAALEELEGLAAGQNCRREDLETVLFTTYARPPACGCSCLAVSRLCRWRTPSTPGDWPSGSPLSTRPGPGRV